METPSHNNSTSWSYATNWTIAHGSLETSVTVESWDSPIDSETVDSTRKSPLILKPPLPDSGPCEIKISFTQKHEIRQVYVRSTARVYEIYFAPALQSSNEYLCTVRCSIAARDEELLRATDIEEAVRAHTKGSNGELAEEKNMVKSNIGTNDDDWVEVKVPDSPLLDNRNSSLPQKTNANTRSIEDFYEATAEITDADPCMSLTLRLLSLQSKGCVYVDEVYVFADPVESGDSENQPAQVGNSAGSSLMAMLAPTLLQLSKSGIGRIQDKHASDTMGKQEYPEIGPKTTHSTNIANEVQQDEKFSIADRQAVKLQDVDGATAEPPQSQIPTQVFDREKNDDSVAKNDLPYWRVERVLDQLLSRVSRVEELCLRFEENMLKPINSMEARLQRVEQQLEVLAKNFQYSGFPSCTRIYAPSFSCNESNSSSFYNEGSDYPPCGELEKKDSSSDKLSNPPDDTFISVSVPQFLPSLVVTAPEFSCGDAEEDNDVLEPSKDSPQEKKPPFSIDDALASALAGFVSTTVQPSKYTQSLLVTAPEFTSEENGNDEASIYTQTLKITAPEFTGEENGNDDKIASPSVENEKSLVSYDSSRETNRNECINDSDSASNNSSLAEGVGQVVRIVDDAHTEETSEGVDGEDQFHEGDNGSCSLGTSIDCPAAEAKHDLAKADDYQVAEEISRQKTSNRMVDVSVSEKNDILKLFLGNQTEDSSDTMQQGAAASTGGAAEGSDKDMLQNVSKSSCASSVVDFEIPILDVKFATWENSNTKSPLEALLTGVAEFDIEAPYVQESDDHGVIGEQSNLIFMEGGEPIGPLTNNHLLVDLDSYDLEVPSSMEGEGLQNHPTSIDQEMSASLI